MTFADKRQKSEKQKRLEKALRENLRKRKSQQRERENKQTDQNFSKPKINNLKG